MKFKKGDRVYYHRQNCPYYEGYATISCRVIKVNSKTLNLHDGEFEYKNVREESVVEMYKE